MPIAKAANEMEGFIISNFILPNSACNSALKISRVTYSFGASSIWFSIMPSVRTYKSLDSLSPRLFLSLPYGSSSNNDILKFNGKGHWMLHPLGLTASSRILLLWQSDGARCRGVGLFW
jgi:hypothetical protein